MKIVIEGASRLDASYGLVNVHLALAFAKLGHHVILSPWDQPEADCRASLAAEGGEHGVEVASNAESPDVRIRQIWPPVWRRPEDRSLFVVIQPWEFGSIPISWLNGIEHADAVFVPSTYVKAGYVQSGVDPAKVWVIPNGTDLAAPITPRPMRHPDTERELLFVGGGIFRKGVDVLVAALDALDDHALSRLRLTIKESGYDSYYAGQSLVDRSLDAAPRVAARTKVLRTQLPRTELRELYQRSDLLVHPYRSEGFALPVLEAMACGLPVCVTKGGSTDDFCPAEGAIFIESSTSVAATPYVDEELTVDLPYFREPNREHLARILNAVAAGTLDPDAARSPASAHAQTLSWDRVARVAEVALHALAEGRHAVDTFTQADEAVTKALGDSAEHAWVDAVRKLVRIGDATSAAALAEIACQLDPADLKRVTALRSLTTAAASQPDLWSGSPWRLELQATRRERTGIPTVVHRHEGDFEAVTATARAISPYFTGCKTVLDLGCGLGAMMRALRTKGVEVIGVEGDPRLVTSLCNEGFDVVQGWIPRDLGLIADRRYDGVFMGHIIEHLSTDDALETIRWAADHLNEGGVLVLQTPDFAIDLVSGSNFWLDPTHVRPYPLPLLIGMLESAGFSPIKGGCRSLAPHAPLDVVAVGRLGRRRADRQQGVATELPSRTNPTVHLVSHGPAPRPETRSGRRRTRLLHVGLFSSTSGMAQAGRALLDEDELRRAGIDTVRVDLESNEQRIDPSTISFSDALAVSGDLAIIDVPVGWLPEVLPRVRANTRIVRLAYEADLLPRYLVDALSNVDAIWAMSQFVVDVALASGLREDRLFLIPPAVALREDATVQLARTGGIARPTVFSSVFSFEPRKNPEALLRAFLGVVDQGLDAELVVKVSMIDEAAFWSWAEQLLGSSAIGKLRCTAQVHCEQLSQDELRQLVRNSDAFVLPTRGEGFGLPFLEAMAEGVPAVCPDIGGHRDFCDETTSFLVRSTSVPCAVAWNIPLFRESRWREVCIDDLIEQLVTVVTRPELVQAKAAASLERARARANHDPRAAATEHLCLLAGRTRPLQAQASIREAAGHR